MRGDIQTLRAIAVVLVLLWHAGVPGVPGGYVGVDVFFVVSGFLMTSIIVRELVTEQRLNVPAFYLRRARRLFPAALVALLGTALLTVLVLPVHRWRDVGGDLVASAVYLVNWRLAERSVDYLAQETAASPLQHFWSLAVEEQFYLAWPIVLIVATVVLGSLRRRTDANLRPVDEHRRAVTVHQAALIASAAVLAVSLAWSAWFTHLDPGRAYFVTTTRLWELALGGLLAALWPRWSARQRPSALAAALVVGGLVAIAWSAATYSSETAFPGVAALLPTLGTAAVLLGGPFLRQRGGLDNLMNLSSGLWVGGISYSLYLWHWPLLVIASEVDGRGGLRWSTGLAVVLVSFVPAWLSTRFVEAPFRRGKVPSGRAVLKVLARWTLGFGTITGGVGLAIVLVSTLTPLGAEVRAASGQRVALSPPLATAREDVYQPFFDGCPRLQPGSRATRCVGGDPDGELSIAVVGDSHAAMWMNGLDAAGADRGWRVELMGRGSCPAADVLPVGKHGPRTDCQEWLQEVLTDLARHPRDVVITAHVTIPPLSVDGKVVPTGESDELMAAGLVRTWSELESTGALVVSVAPTPRFRESRVECLAQHRDDPTACDAAEQEVLDWTQGATELATRQKPEVRVLDLNDLICPERVCRATQGDVLVYRDSNHLTRTWVLGQTEEIGRRLEALLID